MDVHYKNATRSPGSQDKKINQAPRAWKSETMTNSFCFGQQKLRKSQVTGNYVFYSVFGAYQFELKEVLH